MARSHRLSSLLLLSLEALAACGPFFQPVTPVPSPTERGIAVQTPVSTALPTPTPLPELSILPEALQGVKVRVWHAYTGQAAQAFTGQLTAFNADNEWGIMVYQVAYPGYSEILEAARASLSGGEPPELVVLLPEQALALEDAIVDVNPYLYDPRWGLTEEERADLPSVFWSQDVVEDIRMGVPAQRTVRLMAYNQAWASELGFNTLPLTADEFQGQACAANASKRQDADPVNDGYGGWVVDADPYTTFSWFSSFQGGVLDGTSYRFSRPENLAALSFVKSLYDNYCAYLSTEPTPYQPFANRSGLFVTLNLGELGMLGDTLARSGNRDAWTVLPFPGDGPSLVVFGSSYTLLETTHPRQLAAWLFLRWLLSPANQAGWARATGLFPMRTSSLDLLADYRAAHPQWGAAVDLLPLAQGVPQRASWRQVRYLLGDSMLTIFRVDTPLDEMDGILAEMDRMAHELEGK